MKARLITYKHFSKLIRVRKSQLKNYVTNSTETLTALPLSKKKEGAFMVLDFYFLDI